LDQGLMAAGGRCEIMSTKKELKESYKQGSRPMGVFQFRNMRSGKVYIGSSSDLPAIKNRYIFQLKLGSHKDRELQKEWNEHGEENFIFEILEQLKAKEGVQADYRDDLRTLENKWRKAP
jgi:group I intron endonuclease